MSKKISVYVRCTSTAPSSYYRILQYLYKIPDVELKINTLLTENQNRYFFNVKGRKLHLKILFYFIMITRVTCFLISDLIKKPDILILSKVLIPKVTPTYFYLILNRIFKRSTLIWDFDDHILNSNQISQKAFKYFTEKSSTIIVTHNYLKNLISSNFHYKVLTLPTTDGDFIEFSRNLEIKNKRKILFENEIHLIWVATSGNLIFLSNILKYLDLTAKKVKSKFNKQLVLNVVCNLPLRGETSSLVLNNHTWSKPKAVECMLNSHIGLMPLTDNEFTRGKGGFKLIQYMSIKLPVIASDIGFNSKIVDSTCGFLVNNETTDWCSSILKIIDSFETWNNFSESSFKRWQDNFSYEYNYREWDILLKK